MKTRLTSLLIKTLLVVFLFVGFLLVWASLQSFETLASLLNHLASDGELESFTMLLYRILKIPFAVVGIGLALLAGFMLFRWKNTEIWLREFPTQTKQFFSMLPKDMLSFIKDVKLEFVNLGKVNNFILLGVIFVSAVVRLEDLHFPLSHDEAYMYGAFASRSLWHMVSNYHLPNNHVLLSVIMKITTILLGNHIWTLRLPTILAGVLMVPATYFFAKRFYSIETAILSSIFVAVFPVLVLYSVLARGYAIIALFTLLLFILADYIRNHKNRFAWLLIVLLSALGFFTIPIMLFPFGALYIWLIGSYFLKDTMSYEPRFDFLKYWVVSGLVAAFITILLYTPIFIYSYERFFGNGFIAPVEWNVFLVTISTRLRNTWMEWTEFIPLWISLLSVFGFLVSLIFHKRFSKQKFPLQIAFLIWIVIMLIVRRPDMLPRFWLFLAAPILVWSAAGIVEPLKRIPFNLGRNWSPGQVFVITIFAFVVVQSALKVPSLPARLGGKDDMEKTTIYLKDYLQQGDLVTASTARLPAMRYYFNYHGIPQGYIRESGKFQRAFIIVDNSKNETLHSDAPKLGFDVSAIDEDTAKILVQFDYLTVYECSPRQ